MKFAVTDLLEFIVNVQVVDVPEQSPLHPLNVYPLLGVAVSVTDVPDVYVDWFGDLVIVPFVAVVVMV